MSRGEGPRRACRAICNYAAAKLEAAKIGLLLEPVNSRDIPGFFVDRPSVRFSILAAVGAKNLYAAVRHLSHAQVMEGDLANTIEREFDRIGHIQVADNPGRHEPGTGEINYPFVFRRSMSSAMTVGSAANTSPTTTTIAGLGWLRPYLAERAA